MEVKIPILSENGEGMSLVLVGSAGCGKKTLLISSLCSNNNEMFKYMHFVADPTSKWQYIMDEIKNDSTFYDKIEDLPSHTELDTGDKPILIVVDETQVSDFKKMEEYLRKSKTSNISVVMIQNSSAKYVPSFVKEVATILPCQKNIYQQVQYEQ